MTNGNIWITGEGVCFPPGAKALGKTNPDFEAKEADLCLSHVE